MVDTGLAVSALSIIIAIATAVLSFYARSLVGKIGDVSDSLARIDENVGRMENELRDVSKTVARIDARSDGGLVGEPSKEERYSEKYDFISGSEIGRIIDGKKEIDVRLPKSLMEFTIRMEDTPSGVGIYFIPKYTNPLVNVEKSLRDISTRIANSEMSGAIHDTIVTDEDYLVVDLEIPKTVMAGPYANEILQVIDEILNADLNQSEQE